MKKCSIVIVLLVLAVLLIGCAGKQQRVASPNHFVCYQDGKVILDVETYDGPVLTFVSMGSTYQLAWVWSNQDGTPGILTNSDSVSCLTTPLGK